MSSESQSPTEAPKQSIISRLRAWGESSLPPALLSTLITPLHLRPPQLLPLLFPPVLLFTSYVNLNGYKRDAAGASAAWSGLYLLLALRRRQPQHFLRKFGARGIIRGSAMGLAGANVVGGGVAYGMGERGRANKWIGKGSEGE